MNRSLSTLLLLLGAACGAEKPAATADTADTASPRVPDLPTSTCDGAGYSWQPLDAVGQVVRWDHDEALSLSAEGINTLLESQGYGALTPVPHDVTLYRVRYTTQDRGELVEATGFAAFPVLDEPAEVPLLMWLHPTMGFSDACAPTAQGVVGAAFPVLFASMGFAVAAPDYLGMSGWGDPSDRPHPWMVAEPTAVASLDMARATLGLHATLDLPARPDPARTVAWGASQGAHAALWVDRYASRYAPELTLAAVVAGVAPTDLVALAERGATTWSDTTAGLAGALVALQRWYGGAADLEAALLPEIATGLPALMDSACSDFGELGEIDGVDDVYTADFLAAAQAGAVAELPDWGCYLAESSLLRNDGVPRESEAPVFMVLGEDDDLAYAPPARDDAEALCAQGVQLELVTCQGADHVSAAVDSLPLQLDWIRARLDGAPLESACTFGAPVACEAAP